MMKTTTIYGSLFAILAGALLPGCGGGDSSVPTVTARPKRAAKTDGPIPGDPGNPGGNPKSTGGVGSFTGVITYDGTPPAVDAPASFNPNDPNTDKVCRSDKVKPMVKDLSLLVNPANKGIKNVFVYVYKTKVDLPTEPAPESPVVFDQKFCTFLNPALIVRVNQPVKVTNSDQTSHNAHTYPSNAATAAYSQNLGPGGTDTYKYGGEEKIPVKVGCDIHGWMVAYQLPLDHGFATLTDENGKFTIEGLPEGDYTFRVFHARSQLLERELKVFIEGGKPTERKFNYPASRFGS